MQLSWKTFLSRYGPLARAVANRLSGRPQDAEDIVQEAAVALHAALSNGKTFESPAHARNYFLRTVHNLALKARSRPAVLPHDEQAPAPASYNGVHQALVEERRKQVSRALSRLTRDHREIVDRRFVHRHTLARIASDLGLPLSTLYARERAALERLRRALSGLEGEQT